MPLHLPKVKGKGKNEGGAGIAHSSTSKGSVGSVTSTGETSVRAGGPGPKFTMGSILINLGTGVPKKLGPPKKFMASGQGK